MATGRPWYQRNGGEFILGTVHMDLETRGAYSLILDLLNDRDRPLPDEPRFIAGVLNCSVRKWQEIRKRLMAEGKLVLDDQGQITNPRFEREHAARRAVSKNAVEFGRQGGKKSAARRAREPELPLPDQAQDPKVGVVFEAEKTPHFAPRVKDKLGHSPSGSNKSSDLAQAPPQASRARKSPETRVLQTNESIDLEPENPVDRSDHPEPALLDSRDLKALLDASTEAAGFRPTSPSAISRELALIQQWRDLGIDFNEVVIPTIRAAVAKSNDPTSSLKRFDRQILYEHARHKATPANGEAYRPPRSPLLDPPDEDPALRPIRLDLLDRLGPRLYSLLMNDVRLGIGEQGDKRMLLINGRDYMTEIVVQGRSAPLIREIARAHGFSGLWKGSG